jgi:hypothetical protein
VSVSDLLRRLVEKLDAAGVPYMVAGSFASTYHGVPRSTQDIDVVIDPTPSSLDTFLASLPEDDYYVDADTARDALRRRSQFNLIDMATGWKVDLIVRKARAFSVEEFRRRELAELFATRVFLATAEDSIVAKLEWAKLGDSERQLRDVSGIMSVRATAIDHAYIEHWVSELDLVELWKPLLAAGEATVTLYRPVGQKELDLIERSGRRAFPPRLPEQPIFYPVLDEEYAAQIARDWNTEDAASGNVGYVTRFQVRKAFLDRYPVQTAGSSRHREYWIPAEDLIELNANIAGMIEVVAKFLPSGKGS